MSKEEAVRFVLNTHLMFSGLNSDDKQQLAPLFEVKNYNAGQVVAEQGQNMAGMYVVYSGKLRLKETKAGKRTSLGEFGTDSTFGEFSLIQAKPWDYQITASEDSSLLVLPADKVRPLLAGRPSMSATFKTQVGVVELGQRLRGMLGAAKYTPEQFTNILSRIGIKKGKKSKYLFKQDMEDRRLYYIETGAVDLERTLLSGEKVILDRVGARELVGEGGALPDVGTNGIQPHSALCVMDTTVLVINEAEVQKILAINPALHEKLRVRFNSMRIREKEEKEIKNRAEGADQRIKLADSVTEEEFLAKHAKAIDTFPNVRQFGEQDNAAACLTMVVQHYGKPFTLGQVREIANLSIANPTPNAIITAAEILGISARAYAVTFEQMARMQLPVIVGWEGYRYSVIYKITDKEVSFSDSLYGQGRLPRQQFITSWTRAQVTGVEREDPTRGVVIGLEPTVEFTRLEPPKSPIHHFLDYILPHWKYFAEGLLAALTINFLGLATPLFVQSIVDTVVVHKDADLLKIMLVGMALVTFFTVLSKSAQALLLAYTTARIDLKLVAEFYRHVLSLPMNFFLSRNKGEILARFGENQKIRHIIAGSTISTIMSLVMVVIYLFMMVSYNGTLTIIAMCSIPLYFLLLWFFVPKIKTLAQKTFITNSQSQSYLIESLNGIEAVKATSNEYFARSRWENQMTETINLQFQSQRLELVSKGLYEMVQSGTTIAILFFGASSVIAGQMTIGELMGFQMLMGAVMGPILSMLDLINQFQEVRIAIDRVGDVLSVKPEQTMLQPDLIPASLTHSRGEIIFEDVNFSYVANGKENAIMRNFNLEIEPGMRVAFVGPSGCGKSTIAKMILGFNIPQSGYCKIDGRDIRTLELASLRSNIGVVLQDSFLFGGTVAQNIALGDPEPDMQAVKEASRLAGADEFIIRYPLGYNTLVGEKGIGVSGGQRQRICIARALYRQPKILIFDEATSALDNESEARIMENMQGILAGRTSISIAHRLTTVMDSDMICFIRDGQVQEKGTHRQLLDREYLRAAGYRGLYYTMAQTQFDLPPLNLDFTSAPAAKERVN